MQHLMLDPIPEHLMEDGTRWEPEVCDQEVVASLLWAMADGAKVVDMVETKPWTHWRKMRLVDFASIAARVMHGLKRAHAGYPAGVSVGGYTFMQRYSMIMELMRVCEYFHSPLSYLLFLVFERKLIYLIIRAAKAL